MSLSVKEKPNRRKLSHQLVESFDDFQNWHNYFNNQNLADRIDKLDYELKSFLTKKWFNFVQDKHKDLRYRIGGITSCIECNLENILIPLERSYEVEDIIYYIFSKIPDWGRRERYSSQHLLLPILPNGMKTSKHIMQFADRIGIREGEKIFLGNLVSKLGELWKNNSCTKKKVFCTITTATKNFIQLGHYDADQGSCFRHLGENTTHKYHLAGVEDSFVFLITEEQPKNPTDILENNIPILGRMWGCWNQQENVLNFCNAYLNIKVPKNKRLKFGEMKVCATKVAEKVLELDEVHLHENKITCYDNEDFIYHNCTDSDWSFAAKGQQVSYQIIGSSEDVYN